MLELLLKKAAIVVFPLCLLIGDAFWPNLTVITCMCQVRIVKICVMYGSRLDLFRCFVIYWIK